MGNLQIYKPELHYIRDEWLSDFKDDVEKQYWYLHTYHSVMGQGVKQLPHFESISDLTDEWLFKVASYERFCDREEYRTLSPEESDKFFAQCRVDDELNFKQDLYTVLLITNLVFTTSDGRVENSPVRTVW